MLVTIINLRRSYVSIEAFDLSLPPSSTRSVRINRDLEDAEIEELQDLQTAGHISYSIADDPDTPDDFEDAQLSMLNSRTIMVSMLDAANVTGGGTTQTVGFSLVNLSGKAVREQVLLQFAVFDDAALSVSAANATLNTASKGTIVSGGGGTALKIKTDANGEFECILTDFVDETVYLGCSTSFGGPSIDCRATDTVAFS